MFYSVTIYLILHIILIPVKNKYSFNSTFSKHNITINFECDFLVCITIHEQFLFWIKTVCNLAKNYVYNEMSLKQN